jgi:glycosyltransferase involved in cell wall biosynthesis
MKHSDIISAQISDALPPILDGVAHTVVNYAKMINEHYGKAYTIGPRVGRAEFTEQDIRCRSIPIPRSRPYRLMVPWADRQFLRTIDRLPLDIVHAHSPFVSGSIALRLARKHNIPLVTTLHSKYRDDFKKYVISDKIADMLVRRVCRFYENSDDVWVPNNATGLTLREYGYEGPYHVVYNGVDFTPPTQSQIAEMRVRISRDHSIPESGKILSFVGQMSWKKNIRLILVALHELSKKRRDVHMLFVGEGPDLKAVHEFTRKLGLEKHIHFLGRISDRKELMAVYAASDIFLFPSVYDNDPLVVKEAAACSTPSLLVRGANAAELVRDDENGFLIDHDSGACASRLNMVLDNRQLLQASGVQARHTIYRSWETVAEEVVDRYRYLIDKVTKS